MIGSVSAASLALGGVAGCRRDAGPPEPPDGHRVYEMRCAQCHAAKVTTIGPSLHEIAGIYGTDVDGVVKWAKAPGRKRKDMTQMPSFGHLMEEDLRAVATWMLEEGKK